MRHGCPVQFHSNQGRNYASILSKELFVRLAIDKMQSTSYHAQGNGRAEVFVKFLGSNLGILGNDAQSNWDLLLPLIAFIHKTTVNDTINETPFFMIYGRDPVLPADLALGHHHNRVYPIFD